MIPLNFSFGEWRPKLSFCATLLLLLTAGSAALADERLTLNLDPDWKFTQADPTGASKVEFDDHAWKPVSLPHTYNDTDTFDDWSLPGHRGEQNQWGGRTWYRKMFSLPKLSQGKKVYIEIEAARQEAEVYLNGHLLGVSKTGFIPFGFDLTPFVRFDAPNILAVMCDNRFMKDPGGVVGPDGTPAPKTAPTKSDVAGSIAPPASENLAQISAKVNEGIPEEVDQLQADQIPWNNPHWHPAHGGLYRNVRLYVMDPLHVSLPLYSFLQTAGPYVYATDISSDSAKIHLEIPVENGRAQNTELEVRAQIVDRDGRSVLDLNQRGTVAAGDTTKSVLEGTLKQPQLWEPAYPYLYHAKIAVLVGGRVIDTTEVPLGIRFVRWDAATGFWINGHHVKLHGWGQKPTDEWPGLGAAQPDWLHYYTLSLMKEAGGNWVRWGHCASGLAMIEAGDELGIMAEQPGLDGESDTVGAAWKVRAEGFRDTLIYFRNNPSIMIWEGGNQKVTLAHVKQLRGIMDEYDPHGGRAYAHRRSDATDQQFMDVCIGTEGGRESQRLPVVEGEYDREESPRRVWDDFSPPNFGYPEAKGQTYQLTAEQYAVNEVAQYVLKVGAANHCGGANWIFSDSTSGGRLACEVARSSGEVDGVRLPKEGYYVCQAMFRNDPQVHIIGHWNYALGVKKPVYVAANGDEVELFVNGTSVGKAKPQNRYLFTFDSVAWEPGEIKAVTYRNGAAIATTSIHTVGPAVALRLTPIVGPKGFQADGSDIALIDVEAVDAKGERCPTFQKRVDFSTDGAGIWRGGYDSGKIKSINKTFVDVECGINRVAVKSLTVAGSVTVAAVCGNLKPATLTLFSRPIGELDGYSLALPAQPVQAALTREVLEEAPAPASVETKSGAGRFLSAFSYSGPTATVSVQEQAHDGAKIYADRNFVFQSLPPLLADSDYVQAANADKLYSAVDLMDFSVKADGNVYVAYDARLTPPDWLQHQFKPTEETVAVNGQAMKIFEHPVHGGESVTLGSNTEDRSAKSCNMYVVFVKH